MVWSCCLSLQVITTTWCQPGSSTISSSHSPAHCLGQDVTTGGTLHCAKTLRVGLHSVCISFCLLLSPHLVFLFVSNHLSTLYSNLTIVYLIVNCGTLERLQMSVLLGITLKLPAVMLHVETDFAMYMSTMI